jgi:hypothetical protein
MKLKIGILLSLICSVHHFATASNKATFEYTIKNNTQVSVQAIQNSEFCDIDICVVAPGGSTTIPRPCKINKISFGIGKSLFDSTHNLPDTSACYAKNPFQKMHECDIKSRCLQTDKVNEIEPSTWVINQYTGTFVYPSEQEDKSNGVLKRYVLEKTEEGIGYIITQLISK